MRRVSTDPSPNDPDPDDLTPRQKESRQQAHAYQGAAEAVAALLIAAGGGYWLDGRFDTSPILLILCTLLGFAAFVVRLMRLGRQFENPEKLPPP